MKCESPTKSYLSVFHLFFRQRIYSALLKKKTAASEKANASKELTIRLALVGIR